MHLARPPHLSSLLRLDNTLPLLTHSTLKAATKGSGCSSWAAARVRDWPATGPRLRNNRERNHLGDGLFDAYLDEHLLVLGGEPWIGGIGAHPPRDANEKVAWPVQLIEFPQIKRVLAEICARPKRAPNGIADHGRFSKSAALFGERKLRPRGVGYHHPVVGVYLGGHHSERLRGYVLETVVENDGFTKLWPRLLQRSNHLSAGRDTHGVQPCGILHSLTVREAQNDDNGGKQFRSLHGGSPTAIAARIGTHMTIATAGILRRSQRRGSSPSAPLDSC